MRMFLMGALMAMSSWAGAQETKTRVHIDGFGAVPYVFLFEERGAVGEGVDALALRVAPRLVAYSEETGFEACGVMAKGQDGSWAVRVGSNTSHVACANIPDHVPEGFVAMALTIHSHGNGAAKLNRTDLRFMNISEDPRSKHMFGELYGQNRHRFSERDLGGLPGYLAAPEAVLRHDGKGKVWTVEAPAHTAP